MFELDYYVEQLISIKQQLEKIANSELNIDSIDNVYKLRNEFCNTLRNLGNLLDEDSHKKVCRLTEENIQNIKSLLEVVGVHGHEEKINEFYFKLEPLVCEYCHEEKEITQADYSRSFIKKESSRFCLIVDEDYYGTSEAYINYCPICGRNLDE